MNAIVICGAPERPGEATRTNPLRALRLRLPHSRRAGHRFSPNRCDLGAVIFSRVTEPGGWQTTTGHRVPLQFIWALSVPRTVFSGLHRAPALFQSSARAVAYVFQALPSLPCVFIHALKEQHGVTRWKEKAFPNSTKVLAKVK